jgi:hypothetical protein
MRGVLSDASKHIGKPGLRIDVVHFGEGVRNDV